MFRWLRSRSAAGALLPAAGRPLGRLEPRRCGHALPPLTCHRYAERVRRDESLGRLGDADLSHFDRLLGGANVLRDGGDTAAHNVDWLGIFRGRAACVLTPRTEQQVAAVVRHCYERRLALVPQGGNTGLVGGSVPVFDEVVLSLARLDRHFDFDPLSGVLSCSAGCILQALDERLAEHGYMMPIDLGARGSCHIGGNVATNAGGIRLLRYGPLHAHVLGVRAALADGGDEPLALGGAVRKDNTGLRMHAAFVGSEGLVGVITGVTMTAVPRPRAVGLAMLAVPTYAKCVEVLSLARRTLGETLSSFEFMDGEQMRCVRDNLGHECPVAADGGDMCYLLVETSGSVAAHDESKMARFLERCLGDSLAADGVQSASGRQSAALWAVRECGAEALRADGHTYKQDISVPLEHFHDVAEATRRRLKGANYTRVTLYGHMADGNAHLNVTSERHEPDIDRLLYPWLYEWVRSRGGSISAEHGIGFAKAPYMRYAQSDGALRLMRRLKRTFDPRGILNPYKVLP